MKTKELLRVVFISFEFVWLFGVVAWSKLHSQSLDFVGSTIRSDPEVIKWLPVLPGALCAFAVNLAWKLTVPLEQSSIELIEWPGYWRLQMRRNVSLFWAISGAAASILLWIFSKHLTNYWLGAWTAATLGVSSFNCACMLLASFVLREIMEK
jgi:hypothetical protein